MSGNFEGCNIPGTEFLAWKSEAKISGREPDPLPWLVDGT